MNVGCVGDILWLVSHFVCILFNETENTAMICFMDSYIISSPNEVVPNVTGSELVGGPEILRMDQGNPDAPPAIPHAEQAMGDLDLALRLGPPSPTKEALERELSTFLSSFGKREVRRDVLEGTIRKLDLNSASPEKLFFEDPTTYAGTFQQTGCCFHS